MKRLEVLPLLLVILCFGRAGAGSKAVRINPMVQDSAQCGVCHENAQVASLGPSNPFPVRGNISEICAKCHESHVSNHPVRVVPSFKVPGDLPVTPAGEISCVTCHNPHNERYSDRAWQARSLAGKFGGWFNRKKEFETYFLRRNNAQGELCLACHHEEREE